MTTKTHVSEEARQHLIGLREKSKARVIQLADEAVERRLLKHATKVADEDPSWKRRRIDEIQSDRFRARIESRHAQLAYAFLRFVPYRTVETTCREKPSFHLLVAELEKVGLEVSKVRQAIVREWLESTYPPVYLISRADLMSAQQAVASAHAMARFMVEHPKRAGVWKRHSERLCLLTAEGLGPLRLLADCAEKEGVPVTRWHEPDFQDQLFSIAIDGRALCRVDDLTLSRAVLSLPLMQEVEKEVEDRLTAEVLGRTDLERSIDLDEARRSALEAEGSSAAAVAEGPSGSL